MVLLATMMSARAAIATDAVAVPPGEWTLQPGCDETCGLWYVSGEPYVPAPSVVASPGGTTYSVSHRVGADLDGAGPQSTTCFFINNPLLPGAPDDIVTFDAVAEPIRTDLFGTVPRVSESDTGQPNGRRLIVITTQSQPGTDLFPSGFISGGVSLKDACFSIGLDDPLTWVGSGTIFSAFIDFLIDEVPITERPFDAISFFTAPWNGVVTITLPNGAGNGINGVRLSLTTEKSIIVPNDGCRGQIVVTDGDTQYSTIGATTDGPDDALACRFSSYSDIGSDIWYRYAATCDGNLTVDLCNSNYDTKVAVYNSPTCSVSHECPVQSPPLGCNDDFCGLRSSVTVPAVLGHCYTIRIGGYLGVQGTGTMRVSCDVIPPPSGACCDNGSCFATLTEADCGGRNGAWFEGASCPSFACPVTPPPNDACTDCIRVLTGVPYNGRTRAATGTAVSSCADNDTLDAWNCWTADCTGRVSITTCGSAVAFDTTLAVYDACGGDEIGCDDDGCQAPNSVGQSAVTLDVTEGTTYYLRVAGYDGDFGNYMLNVETCKNACCLPSGLCGFATSAQCDAAGGTSLGPGSVCRGDLNGDGVDDACASCPQATIAGAAPQDGTVDARQPNSATAPLPRHGIGSPGEPGTNRESIVIVLNPRVPEAEGCFSLCETKTDPLLGENLIQTVTYHGAGVYELVLDHAITAGGVTRIKYLGDGSSIYYTAQPANVDASSFSDASDIQEHIDCCLLSGLCTPVWGAYSCDIDRSNLVTPADILAVIDLLNGTQVWDIWLGSPLPTQGTCP